MRRTSSPATRDSSSWCGTWPCRWPPSRPLYVSRDEVPESVLEEERRILRAAALNEGKPEHIVDKIVDRTHREVPRGNLSGGAALHQGPRQEGRRPDSGADRDPGRKHHRSAVRPLRAGRGRRRADGPSGVSEGRGSSPAVAGTSPSSFLLSDPRGIARICARSERNTSRRRETTLGEWRHDDDQTTRVPPGCAQAER